MPSTFWDTLTQAVTPRSAEAEVRATDPNAQTLLDRIDTQRNDSLGTLWRARTLDAARRVPERVDVGVQRLPPEVPESVASGFYRPGKIVINPAPSAIQQWDVLRHPDGSETRTPVVTDESAQEQTRTLGHELGHFLYQRNRPQTASPPGVLDFLLNVFGGGQGKAAPGQRPVLPQGLWEENLADFLGGTATIAPSQQRQGTSVLYPHGNAQVTEEGAGRPYQSGPQAVPNVEILRLLQQLWGQ